MVEGSVNDIAQLSLAQALKTYVNGGLGLQQCFEAVVVTKQTVNDSCKFNEQHRTTLSLAQPPLSK